MPKRLNRQPAKGQGVPRDPTPTPLRLIFEIYQALHHLASFTGKPYGDKPKPFSVKIGEVTRHLRPALLMLNPLYWTRVESCAEEYRKALVEAHMDHYKYGFEFLKGQFAALLVHKKDLSSWLNQAKTLCSKRYRKKFRSAEFAKIEKLLPQLCVESRPTAARCEKETPATPVNRGDKRKRVSSPTTQETTRQAKKAQPPPNMTPVITPPAKVASTGTGDGSTPTRNSVKRTFTEAGSPTSQVNTPNKRLQSTSPEPVTPGAKSPVAGSPSYADKARSPRPTTPDARSPVAGTSTQAEKTPPSPPKSPRPTRLTNGLPRVHRFDNLKRHGLKKRPTQGEAIHAEWSIPKIVTDIIMLGDSNFNFFKNLVTRTDIQVLSYPGLKLDIMLKLITRYGTKHGNDSNNPGMRPKHVILNVGLNDRESSQSTNKVNVEKIIHEAKRQFKNATISLCEIPVDDSLEYYSKQIIKQLNDDTRLACEKIGANFIPAIPKEHFSVKTPTNVNHPAVHWTPDCAQYTLSHIFNHLN